MPKEIEEVSANYRPLLASAVILQPVSAPGSEERDLWYERK
jgi:hypothetical protein